VVKEVFISLKYAYRLRASENKCGGKSAPNEEYIKVKLRKLHEDLYKLLPGASR
jgi:hypothetical protein